MNYLAYYLAYFLPQLYRKTCEIPIVFQTEKSRKKAGASQTMHRFFRLLYKILPCIGC